MSKAVSASIVCEAEQLTPSKGIFSDCSHKAVGYSDQHLMTKELWFSTDIHCPQWKDTKECVAGKNSHHAF